MISTAWVARSCARRPRRPQQHLMLSAPQSRGSLVAIEVISRQRLIAIDRAKIVDLVTGVLSAASRTKSCNAITVVFVRDSAIRRLNREYRGKDQATDVLSFPAENGDVASDPAALPDYLGDIVISAETAIRQAR